MKNQHSFRTNLEFARELDAQDPLSHLRKEFRIPKLNGKETIYFCGNSLGPAPKKARKYILEEFDDWAEMGVEGHLEARHPWLPYHEIVTQSLARLVGALPIEVVAMNSLTVNLNLMMVSFYRPVKERYKVLIEGRAFSSDRYAISQQCRFHEYDPEEAIVELMPQDGEETLRTEDIVSFIHKHGDEIALVLMGNVNYLTGQFFDIPTITKAAHERGCNIGWDLAHGVGNVPLHLHQDGPDFAVWCSYKYLNSGPGAIASCFVHERYAHAFNMPRFIGWWAHDKKTRFQMEPDFIPIPGVEGWQNSNPPIFQLAALRASLEIFDEVGMESLRKKSLLLTGYLEFLVGQLPGYEIITPRDPDQRGCHLSLRIHNTDPQRLVEYLKAAGVICDFRKPDIIRVAPAPLFNKFEEVYRFVEILKQISPHT